MVSGTGFYIEDHKTYVPSEFAASPWNREAQSGVALSGLSAHLLDQVPTLVPMQLARLNIDIVGSVPMHALVPSVRVVREGKNLQLLEVELSTAGRICLRASALRVRVASSPERWLPPTRPFPGGDLQQLTQQRSKWVETIPIEGDYQVPGPGARWARPLCPVVSGTTLSPLESVAMLADMGSGVGPILPPHEWTFANLDISMHLTRAPRGDWLLIDAISESAGNGIGIANTRLGDRDGMIGSAHQTLFLKRRPPPP